jgi:hypothetical protein
LEFLLTKETKEKSTNPVCSDWFVSGQVWQSAKSWPEKSQEIRKKEIMKTVTGNEVKSPRHSLAMFGTKVNSHAEACAAIGFEVISEPAARLSTGQPIPNSQNLYNSRTGFCLGQHTEQFKFFQPCDSLETLEKARQMVGGVWQSATSLKGGRQIAAFVGLEAKITAPKRGDSVGLSIAQFDRYDGGGLCAFQLFMNVLACDNGAVSQKSLVSFSEKHNGTIKARFAAMEFNLLVNLQNQIEEMQSVVNQLDTAEISRSEVVAFAETLFPSKGEEVSTRTENMREAIVTGFSRGTGNVGRTRWDLFNSVTEFLDWGSTFRETDFSREENRFESLTSGNAARTRSRALELLLN